MDCFIYFENLRRRTNKTTIYGTEVASSFTSRYLRGTPRNDSYLIFIGMNRGKYLGWNAVTLCSSSIQWGLWPNKENCITLIALFGLRPINDENEGISLRGSWEGAPATPWRRKTKGCQMSSVKNRLYHNPKDPLAYFYFSSNSMTPCQSLGGRRRCISAMVLM